ncbi:MAG: methionine biosynthesis protein MetW [Candidatus Pelagibacter sp. TMED165]|nr:MAG: methionine biosynthesis protein MetW [Candidatus Pelagibacter sp. TMED165]
MNNEFNIISKLVHKDSKILDVGCGDGELMKLIKDVKTKNIRGLEISKFNVQKCISKGLTVIEGDAENDLKQFPNLSFDYVILNQTLQAFLNPENVINELLRVGKKAIVTIPNFGYWKVRLQLLFRGTMPITKNLPNEWYNTPNLHMCTIKDFFNFCIKRKINVYSALALNNEIDSKNWNNKKISINKNNLEYKNFFSELGIFLLER